MLLFGHAGITLGAALLAASMKHRKRMYVSRGQSSAGPLRPVSNAVDRLYRYVDIRWILVGALLPDIIDKPLGILLLDNGRVFSHSLVFLAALSIAGVILYRAKHWSWLLAFAFGTLFHLVLDFMWQTPDVFFWPAYGVGFKTMKESNWFERLWRGFIYAPTVSVPEFVGFAVCILFALVVIRRRMVWEWMRWGRTAGE